MKKHTISLILFFSAISSFSQPDTLTCNVYGNPDTGPEFLNTNYYINSDLQEYAGCGAYPAIHVAIIDTADCFAWSTCYVDSLGNFIDTNNFTGFNNECGSCRNRPEKYFIFEINSSDPAQMYYLDTLLRNDSLGGVYFLIYSWLYMDRDAILSINPNLYGAFAELGASNALIQADSVPFIFFARADDSTSAIEVIGTHLNDTLQLSALICNSTISSVAQKENEPLVEIFPNPADDHFTIRSSSEMERVEVYDVLGEKIISVNPRVAIYKFSAINFPPGIYHVSVTGKNNFSVTKKIIVTR